MTARIDTTFARLRSEKRAGLIPFIMGGDPDAQTSLAILRRLPQAGADIIEIGMPFSDPMADGPVIQAAGLRALQAGANIASILAMVTAFRKENQHTPIILMGYFNPICHMGLERFCAQANAAGVDGLIIVDLPPEEEAEFTVHTQAQGLAFIRLIAPTSDDARLPALVQRAGGFVYYISVAGITGAKSADTDALASQLKRLRAATQLPVAVGFGIKTPQQVREVAGLADAVVVGSALVDIIARADSDAPKAAEAFVRELAAGLRS